MNRQGKPTSSSRRQMKVDLPGAAPAVGAAPKKLRSSNPALTIGAPSTREYGKAPVVGPPRGFNLGGAI